MIPFLWVDVFVWKKTLFIMVKQRGKSSLTEGRAPFKGRTPPTKAIFLNKKIMYMCKFMWVKATSKLLKEGCKFKKVDLIFEFL